KALGLTVPPSILARALRHNQKLEPANRSPPRQYRSRIGQALSRPGLHRVMRLIDTNVIGTLYLLQKIGRDMRALGAGRILITSSIAGLMPGMYQAVYNGTKA